MTKPEQLVPNFTPQHELEMLRDKLDAKYKRVVDSGVFIWGDQLKKLEMEVCEYLNVKHAIGVASGCDALAIAIKACSMDRGKVGTWLVPGMTFAATAEAVMHVGGQVKISDIEMDSFGMDPTMGDTYDVDGILPVHLYGQPCDIKRIVDAAAEHDIPLVEDCAQAFGATVDGKSVGTFGKAGCFSFYPTKNLGALGMGGMIITEHDEIAERCRVLRCHGESPQFSYWHTEVGWSSPLQELQAGFLRVKMRYVNYLQEWRNRAAQFYLDRLAGKEAQGLMVLPKVMPERKHVWHKFAIQVAPKVREQVMKHMLEEGMCGSGVTYPNTLLDLPAYSECAGHCQKARLLSKSVLCLPLFNLITEKELKQVVDAVFSALESARQSNAFSA